MSRCTDILICPVCGEPLAAIDRSLRCPRRHTFDLAREGYVHLLPSGHGRSGRTGDTSEMLRARRRTFEGGHYEPVSRAINETGVRHLDAVRESEGPDRRFTAVDAGCGEGYYAGRLRAALASEAGDASVCVFGVDISKAAVRLAARAYDDVFFLVNDVKHRICVADRSVDLLLNVFAPRNPEEFARITRPDGLLLVAIPTERHLRELRADLPLLDIEPEKRERTVEQFLGEFDSVGEDTVEYETGLDGDARVDLLRMTPNYWHLDEETFAQARESGPARVTIAVRILRLRRL